jgi:hypothetical protein
MTTVAQLATRAHVEVGYLLVLQGCPFAFTNRHELAGSGASSWIGTGYGPRRVIEGLDIDGTTLSYGTEMSDGRPDTDDGFTFRILDFERELIEFFRVQTDAIPVGGRLGPKDDPAPTDLIGTSGDNVPIWGAWVNAEAIGPAGERSYYSLLPGGDAAGRTTRPTAATSSRWRRPTSTPRRRTWRADASLCIESSETSTPESGRTGKTSTTPASR